MQPRNQDVDLDGLMPHPQNYNRHPAEQVKRLTKSLQKFGQVRSVVVWHGMLLAGHGVVEAARLLNWRTIRADVLPDDYPEHLALAYIAADNELARQGDPDMAQLAAILEQSKAADAELLEAIGYSDKEFEALLKEVGKGAAGVEDAGAQVDKAEELRQKWGTAAGQLWQLGEHRLICGDCTDPATVARVMGGEKAACMWTDPPYGVSYVGKTKDALTIENDGADGLLDLLSAAFGMADAGALNEGASIYIAAPPGPPFYDFATALIGVGWKWHETLAWVKDSMVLGHSDYHYKHEVIFYGWKGKNRSWYAGRDQVSVFEISRPKRSEDHPTMKPPELVEAMLRNSTVSGGIVYEPFSGSGTTIIACENLGRRCRAVEISPAYVAVALERWAMSTGKTPVLVGDNG